MADPTAPPRWHGQLAYVLMAALCLFAALLPVEKPPSAWPGPDVLLALTLTQALRRPDDVPAPLVALVMLLADLMLQRPPGLLAGCTLLTTHWLRGASEDPERPLLGHWALMALATAVTFTLWWGILGLTFTPRPSAGLLARHAIVTAALWPLIVLVTRVILRQPPQPKAN